MINGGQYIIRGHFICQTSAHTKHSTVIPTMVTLVETRISKPMLPPLTKSIFQQITVRLAYQLRWPEHRYSQILISLEFIFSLTSKATVTNFTRQVTCFSRLCIFIFVKPLKSFSAVLFAELMRKQNGGL